MDVWMKGWMIKYQTKTKLMIFFSFLLPGVLPDILEDMKEECQKYGSVVSLLIPKENPGKGQVSVLICCCLRDYGHNKTFRHHSPAYLLWPQGGTLLVQLSGNAA